MSFRKLSLARKGDFLSLVKESMSRDWVEKDKLLGHKCFYIAWVAKAEGPRDLKIMERFSLDAYPSKF